MRMVAMAVVSMIVSFAGQAGEKGQVVPQARFGIDPDPQRYPQNTPKDALNSVLRAIADKRCDYLLAHLSDPAFVDRRLTQNMAGMEKSLPDGQRVAAAFERLVKTTADGFVDDPSKITELRRIHEAGEWVEAGDTAVASLKGLTARKVFMQITGQNRWVLLDKTK